MFIGTDLYDSEKLLVSCYDDFFVFLNGDIYKDDISMLHELTKMEKSFSVTRTKSTTGIQAQETISETALLDKGDEETGSVQPNLLIKGNEEIDSVRFREIIYSHMYEDTEYEYDMQLNVGVLSCSNISINEIDELINNLIQNLPQAKSEAVLYALHPLSKLVIEEKFQILKKRIACVTIAATSTSAFQIPSICFPVNMYILVDEITHYIKVFGLSVNGEKPCQVTKAGVKKLLCREFLKPGVVFSDIIHN